MAIKKNIITEAVREQLKLLKLKKISPCGTRENNAYFPPQYQEQNKNCDNPNTGGDPAKIETESAARSIETQRESVSACAGETAAKISSFGAENIIVAASYNIHKCIGTDKIFNPQRIIDVIAELKADIVALQEVDKRFGERHGLLDLQTLEEKTGLRPAPIQPIAPQGQGWHGNALFFRRGQLCSVEQIALPGVEPRGAIIADFAFKAGRLRVIAAHFGLLHRSRSLQVQTILAQCAKKTPMPTVLLGDLNEWRIGKKSSLKALAPLFTATAELSPSFPAHFPLLSLDRIFFTPQNLVRSVTVHDTPPARIASDHLPIKAVIHLQNGMKQEAAQTPALLQKLP